MRYGDDELGERCLVCWTDAVEIVLGTAGLGPDDGDTYEDAVLDTYGGLLTERDSNGQHLAEVLRIGPTEETA